MCFIDRFVVFQKAVAEFWRRVSFFYDFSDGRLIFKWHYLFISAWVFSVCLLSISQLRKRLINYPSSERVAWWDVTYLSVGTIWALEVAQQLLISSQKTFKVKSVFIQK